jgi:ABC-type transport system involved in multi-copper enzyme maturation permease subunit
MTAEITTTLRRVEATHPLRGVGGMVAMELQIWFPWRWLILSATGAGVFALIYVPWVLTETNQLGSLLYIFFGLWLAVMLVTVVSLTEGSVLGEIEGGTAAWLAALPLARPAVIVAKFIAAGVGITAVVFTVGMAAYPVLSAASKKGVTEFGYQDLSEVVSGPIGMWGRFTNLAAPGQWMITLAAAAMLLTFVAAVMMLFGTVLRSRSLVFGLGLVVTGVFGGLAFAGSFAAASPAGLIGGIVDSLQAKPAEWATPLIATALWTVGVLLLATWRFNRRELP